MLDDDNSAFLCIRSLRCNFSSKIFLDDDKDDNYFSIDIGSCFKADFFKRFKIYVYIICFFIRLFVRTVGSIV